MIGKRTHLSPWFGLYGLVPLLGLPLIRYGREAGWQFPAWGIHAAFAGAVAYVVLGGWLAYRMTATEVGRDQAELLRRD